jgi:serine phosphatase RsbU (regulator of sigma subunit)
VEEKNRELEIQVIERTSQLRESNEEVKIKSEALEEQNKEILDSISYAQRIQQSILPLAEDISKQFEEYFILFEPREIVSGDFYYFQPVDNKVILAVIDCTGHGVPGAFMSILGKEILDNIILERKILEADMIMNELHKGIRKALKQDQTENRDGMDLSLIVLHKETQYLEFAGARNSLIYISDKQLHEIKGDKVAIGGEQKELERLFTKHQVNISPNTTCYLFSDGYQDQFGGKEKKRFMISRMKELLLEIQRLPMEEQRLILDLKIEDWMADGGERQTDDILMMGVRV